MMMTPDELFQDVADRTLSRSAWGCLTVEEAREFRGHLEALRGRNIGFNYSEPDRPVDGHEMGMIVHFSNDPRKSGKIWFEKDTIQFTTQPHFTYSNWSAARTEQMGSSPVVTIPRDQNWIETVMRSVIEQVFKEYGPGSIWLTNGKPRLQVVPA
ncbi:MAG: hypothetical protein WAO98_04260 [Alphaproteobacteria bacterium]